MIEAPVVSPETARTEAGTPRHTGIVAENLVRHYGKWRVVNDVSIHVNRGEGLTIAVSESRVDRSASVSSMRRMNAPPAPRASSQLNSAVRALPTWS